MRDSYKRMGYSPQDDCSYEAPRRSARKTDKTDKSDDSYTKFLKSKEKELRKKFQDEKKKKNQKK